MPPAISLPLAGIWPEGLFMGQELLHIRAYAKEYIMLFRMTLRRLAANECHEK